VAVGVYGAVIVCGTARCLGGLVGEVGPHRPVHAVATFIDRLQENYQPKLRCIWARNYVAKFLIPIASNRGT
jgi:hypothetical protein